MHVLYGFNVILSSDNMTHAITMVLLKNWFQTQCDYSSRSLRLNDLWGVSKSSRLLVIGHVKIVDDALGFEIFTM